MRQEPTPDKRHPEEDERLPREDRVVRADDPATPAAEEKDTPGGLKRPVHHFLRANTRTAQFLRFGTVGMKVSTIDIGGLYLLHRALEMNLYLSRVASLGAAILVGYLLNRYFTFARGQRGCLYRQMAGHLCVHLTGGLINYGVFTVVMVLAERAGTATLAWMPLFAIVVGGVVGLVFNFIASRRFVFPHRPPGAGGRT